MKVYVASKFSRIPDVRRLTAKLRDAEMEVHADWTGHSAVGHRGRQLHEYLTACAEADFQGVERCDALVMLHDPASRGGFVEVGMALARGKLVVVIGGRLDYPDRAPIFYALPGVQHFEDEDAAVAWLRMLDTKYAEKTREQELERT